MVGDWYPVLDRVVNTKSFLKILKQLHLRKEFFPKPNLMFRPFTECPIDKVKVVVIGGLPYKSHAACDGLAFSSKSMTDDLSIINKALSRELLPWNAQRNPNVIALDSWAQQGVLLLNSELCHIPGWVQPAEYIDPWLGVMNALLAEIQSRLNVVYLRWGKLAQRIHVDSMNQHVYNSYHPKAEFVYGEVYKFFGHFNRVNEILTRNLGIESKIDWIPNP